MDRTNEALDRLTIDFTSGLQTPDHPSGFQAGPRLTSLRNDAGRPVPAQVPPAQVSRPDDTAQPIPAQVSLPGDAAQPTPTQVSLPADAAQPAPEQVSLPDDTAQPTPTQVSLPADAAQPAPEQVSLPDDTAQPTPAQAPVKTLAQPVPKTRQARSLEDIDQYLWRVYQRSTTKRDSSGDFTWKDEAAAARLGLMTKQYVIGGMDRDFRELLYDLGHAMDDAGLNWTILSGFRDDYRQGLASGYKAHVGNSFHGGSRATGGYGHGCAADIEASDGESSTNNAVWRWVDQHGEKFGILRPMKQIDPAHIQPFGGWHDIAFNLRDKRLTAENGYLPASVSNTDAEKLTPLIDTPSGVSGAQFDCVRSHRSGFRLAGLSHHQRMTIGGRMHRAVLFHPGRMHRFGRRRMVVDAGTPDKGASTEIVRVAGQGDAKVTDAEKHAKAEASDRNRRDVKVHDAKVADVEKHAKAEASDRNRRDVKVHDAKVADVEKHAKVEASDRNRRDSKWHKAADTGHSEKHPGKEAPLSADGTRRNATGPDAKEQKVVESKHPQKRAAAEIPDHQARPKSRVADRDEASDKNNKKL